MSALLATSCQAPIDDELSLLVDTEDGEEEWPEGPDQLVDADRPVGIVPGFDLSIAANAADIELAWPDQGPGVTYDVWRSTEAYFEPGDPGATVIGADLAVTAFTDVGGNDDTTVYYRIESDDGGTSATSTTVGKYVHFVSMGFSKISQPLITGITDAATFGNQFPGLLGAHQWNSSTQGWNSWNGGGVPFATGPGRVPITQLPWGYSSYYHHQLGYVPDVEEIQIQLEPGDNLVTVPLSYGATTAGELLAEVSDIYRVGYYDNINHVTVWWDGINGTNFAVPPGGHVHLEVTAPSVWPGESVGPDTNPLFGIGSAQLLLTGYGFTEGVAWNSSAQQLQFVDIYADSIYQWTENSGASLLRGSNGAFTNGMAFDVDGNRLECEHAPQRITRHFADGSSEVVIGDYMGTAFNSPNDVTSGDDGTLYFTDPTFGGLPQFGGASPQALGFRGVYRVTPTGDLHLVDDTLNEPNGIGLSPDGDTLYVHDYAAETLTAYPVAADGSTGVGTVINDDVPQADGMCIDSVGNIYSASGGQLRVFRPDGTLWGTIPVPQTAANCTFGGPDLTTLFIAARTSIYTVDMVIPGRADPGS